MAWLNQVYLETPYRRFGATALQILIECTLKSKKGKSKPLPLSAVETPDLPIALTQAEPTDLWNWTRIWATDYVLKDDATVEWASRWMDYGLTHLPPKNDVKPGTWDAIMNQWVRGEYLTFSERLWKDTTLTTEQKHQFWKLSWDLFLKHAGQSVALDRQPSVDGALQTLVDEQPGDMRVVYALQDGIGCLCKAAEIAHSGPSWAFFTLVAWGVSEDDPQWDLPLQIFGHVAGKSPSHQDISGYLRQNPATWQHLDALIEDARTARLRLEFWFPIAHYQGDRTDSASITATGSVVCVDSATALRLTAAQGVQGLPEVRSQDMFVVVTLDASDVADGYTRAKYEPEEILSFLRVADTRFRWPLADYYYWTAPDQTGLPFMAEWSDPYRLNVPKSVAHVAQVHQWIRSVESQPGELADAVVEAMFWQGTAYSQNPRQTELVSWWIALERLGHGSHDARDTLGKLGGWQWHWGMWDGLPPEKRQRGFYQDQQRMRTLISALARLRNEATHSGRLPKDRDIDYALWLMRHLAHDLTMATLDLVMNKGQRTFDDLSHLLDRYMGFSD